MNLPKTIRQTLFLAALVITGPTGAFAQWNLSGNAGTSSLTNAIGTVDTADLVIQTNEIERGRFFGADGQFRLWSSPSNSSNLHTYFRIHDNTRGFPNLLTVEGDPNNDNSELNLYSYDGASTLSARSDGFGAGLTSSISGGNPGMILHNATGRSFLFDQNYNSVSPVVSGSVDLGEASLRWNHLYLQGTAFLAGLQMATNAQAGYVLTSDANGTGTWQPASSSFWAANGNNIYNTNVDDVGIGTASPQSRLHLYSEGNAANVTVPFETSILRMEANNLTNGLQGNTIFDFGLNTDGKFKIGQEINGNLENRVLIDQNGNVGIGTDNPSERLSVNGFTLIERTDNPTWQNTKVKFGISAGSASDQGLRFEVSEDGGANFQDILHLKKNGSIGIGSTDVNENAKVQILADRAYGLVVNSMGASGANGNAPVGLMSIVNSNQTNAFVVSNMGSPNCMGEFTFRVNGAGRVEATEVEVRSSWCDYVFEEDYELMPLSELEAYLDANKHLPNIPAAEVVENEGLPLGNMQMRMMEKIEELTLYTIQQQKELELLKAQNDELKAAIQTKH